MTTFVLSCYFSILAILCFYGFHRFLITRMYLKNQKSPEPEQRFEELPKVTVQLPLFNEKFVAERVIDATIALDYPKDKLHIQVLDDSTDDTVEIVGKRVAYWQEQGFDIEHVHRVDRVGYKAGALEEGLAKGSADFVAVFDADFIPDPQFLHKTIHFFTNEKIGMVQTRWAHINREDSTLTQIQAMLLDAHFIIEHGGRHSSNLFFNFNGTAGIWRKSTIADAGGWEHDTLTEDLDLSYRAQLKGWQFVFVPNVTSPSELPTDVTAFKSQQHRWAKGSIEVMLKLMPRILRSPIPLSQKLEAFWHLTGNLAYLLMIINSVFFVIPSMMLRHEQAWWKIIFIDGPFFALASMTFVYFYLSAQKAIFGNVKGKKRYVPAIMAIGIGLGVNNTKAVLEALFGIKTAFVRTPKSGTMGEDQKPTRSYRLPKTGWGYLEMALGMMYTTGIIWAISLGNWASIPFLVLFQNGFYYIGWLTIREERRQRKSMVTTKVCDPEVSM